MAGIRLSSTVALAAGGNSATLYCVLKALLAKRSHILAKVNVVF